MSENDDFVSLRKAYMSGQGQTSLNTTFRESLKNFSMTQSLQLSEDSAGNNYITRPGKDTGISPIAVAFPLDGSAKASFTSAFRIFSLLSKLELPCDAMLVGWTSLGEGMIGRDIWFSIDTPSNHGIPPELVSFKQRDSPKDVSVSAVFEVSEQEGVPLKIEGSPVLLEKARNLTKAQTNLRELRSEFARAPYISIVGTEAESIACSIIREYGAYVVALFDNFD
ncbi:hypothetical protein F4806DRAFT_461442 [Annulohypoxylon nitens]|nr:hypothetical protein F4806DRAFT_461442 [Annulohypoxylon nitens]